MSIELDHTIVVSNDAEVSGRAGGEEAGRGRHDVPLPATGLEVLRPG